MRGWKLRLSTILAATLALMAFAPPSMANHSLPATPEFWDCNVDHVADTTCVRFKRSGVPWSVDSATRIVVTLGLALTMAAAAAVALTSGRIGAIEVHAAPDPRAFVLDWLLSNSAGGCSEATDAFVYVPPSTHEKIDKAPAGHRWLSEGNDNVFVGDISNASVTLTGAKMALAPEEAWIMGRDSYLGLIANHYMQRQTPNGRPFWVKSGWERPTAC